MNRRPRSRLGRVLLWIVLIVVALIVLSVLFGGFQKGTKSSLPMGRLGRPGPTLASAAVRTP